MHFFAEQRLAEKNESMDPQRRARNIGLSLGGVETVV
jgi:hypothetical protein